MEFSSSVGSSHVEGWQVVPKNQTRPDGPAVSHKKHLLNKKQRRR